MRLSGVIEFASVLEAKSSTPKGMANSVNINWQDSDAAVVWLGDKPRIYTYESSTTLTTDDKNVIALNGGGFLVSSGGSGGIEQYPSFVALPAAGDEGILYVVNDTDPPAQYVWNGTAYVDFIAPDRPVTVYVNAATPAAATIFDLANPPVTHDTLLMNREDVVYIGTDVSTWTSDSTTYKTYTPPASTAWWLANTTTDAANSKTANIYRIGNVGFDVANPQYKVDIKEYARLQGDKTAINFLKLGVQEYSIGQSSDNKFQIAAGGLLGNPRITLLADGKTGVGTVNPLSVLDVFGSQGWRFTSTSDATVTPSDGFMFDLTLAGSQTFTLPTVARRVYVLRNATSFTKQTSVAYTNCMGVATTVIKPQTTLWLQANDAGAYFEISTAQQSTVYGAWLDTKPMILGATSTAPNRPTVTQVDYQRYRNISGGGNVFEHEYSFRADSVAGASAGAGNYLLTLCGGQQFDPAKYPFYTGAGISYSSNVVSFAVQGAVGFITNGGNYDSPDLFVIPYNATQFRVLHGQGSNVNSNYWASGNFQLNWGSPFVFKLTFKLET